MSNGMFLQQLCADCAPGSAFELLSAGGTVQVPLEQQVWGDIYGAFADKFGINWQVNIAGGAPEE